MTTTKTNEPMKTMKESTDKNIVNISYNNGSPALVINGVCIPFNIGWNSRIYQDSFFRSIDERDLVAEQIIRSVNAMLIDFHYHRRELKYFDSFWGQWCDMINDKDPIDVSCAILEKAVAQLSELFLTCFRNGWKSRRVYIAAAMCLLYEINAQWKNLGYATCMSTTVAYCIPYDYDFIRVSITA